MDPERLRQIERLYHAALEREEGQRAVFLRELYATDEALCREVEAWLASGAKAEVPPDGSGEARLTANIDSVRRMDNLFHAALERPLGERDAFLRQACVGNEALERELRSLLTSQNADGTFLESPAI